MHRHLLLAGLLCGVLWTTRPVVGQGTPDAKGLTGQLNLIKKENELLKRENELLKKEIELLKKEAKAKPEGAGSPKTGAPSRTKASHNGADYELLKCVRNRTNPKTVTLTFSAKCSQETLQSIKRGAQGPPIIGGGRSPFSKFDLHVTARDGEALDGLVTKSPPILIQLSRDGEASKFQITYTGVDKDITELDEVTLSAGRVDTFGGGAVPKKIGTFYHIKIESK